MPGFMHITREQAIQELLAEAHRWEADVQALKHVYTSYSDLQLCREYESVILKGKMYVGIATEETIMSRYAPIWSQPQKPICPKSRDA